MESHGGWVDALSQFWTLAFHFCASVTQFDIRNMVVQHGHWFYLITFLWTFVEGETFVIFAGTFAAQGLSSVRLLQEQYPAALAGSKRSAEESHAIGNQNLEAYSGPAMTSSTPAKCFCMAGCGTIH